MPDRRRVHYVLSTHWDREWHQTFQDFRYLLVQLLDGVLAGLADGRLKGPFQTDGQAIMLEDYLEIRPERRQEVLDLVRAGKLVAGPWYVLPDEFTVSGESLVRNLRVGRDLVRSWGAKPSDAGFMCDMFGHTGQMPQIFAGFGIKGAFIWRGDNAVERANLRWRGSDGTEVLAYRFGAVGYCTYAFRIRHCFDSGYQFDPAAAEQDFARYLQEESARTAVSPLLFFDGCDHLAWDEAAYRLIAERLGQEGPYEFVHTSLDAYLDELAADAARITEVVEGELREPGRPKGEVDQQWLIPGVLSSRWNLKQANAQCQALLCHWAEPLSALAHAATGAEYPQGFLDVAWRYLLQNHPHDSIDGCSVDQVHQDMVYRFDQCRQIADRLAVEATKTIAAAVEGEVGEEELRVTVFNPLPYDTAGVTELTLQLPTSWPCFNEFFGFEAKPSFRIYTPDGTELPYQRLHQAMGQPKKRLRALRVPEGFSTHDVTVALNLAVPALGYTTLTVRPGEPGLPTRHPAVPGLATSGRSMANEFLEVEIEPNGALNLTDRRSGQLYHRLLTFEDCADIGDGWYHGQAVNDQVFTSAAGRAEVALVHDGPLSTTFRLRTTMAVPAEFRWDGMVRSAELVDLVIDSYLTLQAGRPWVDVRTAVHNTALDHRLRVLFPTGAEATTYLADAAFDVVERPIALRADNHLYRELEVETKPQQSWTAVEDGRRGLAVVSAGMLESAVRDLPHRPIALTLFRGTRRTVMTPGQEGGQLLGDLEFAYRIAPGPVDPVALCRQGQELLAGLRTAQLRPADLPLYRRDAALPPTAGWLCVTGPAVVTSVRRVGEGVEVRLFNPTTAAAATGLQVGQPAGFTTWQLVNLDSKPAGEPHPLDRNLLTLPLNAKQIVTIKLT